MKNFEYNVRLKIDETLAHLQHVCGTHETFKK
jgi:hypothetical protein